MNKYSLTAIFFVILAGCAKTSNDGSTSTAAATTCSTGYLYSTYYGCQVQCGTSSIMYNNQCIPTTTSITGTTTTCQSGYLYSAYGCQPQCGTNMVWYNNQCVAAAVTTTTYTSGYTTTTGSMCQGVCQVGYTQVSGSCLPQSTCGACYGQYQGYCYIGDYAHAYYGY